MSRRTARSEEEMLREVGSTGLGPLILDQWSFLDFKEAMLQLAFGNRPNPGTPVILGIGGVHATHVPNWVGMHARRLQAYMILDSYYRNSARHYIHWNPNEVDDRVDRREYGDAYLIVETIKSSVLGNDQKPVVKGVTDTTLDENSDEGKCQTALEEWFDVENVRRKLISGERHGGKEGDIVYAMGWDSKRKRPRLRVYDPGWYFPVLDPAGDDSDFPKRIHVAWEFEDIDENFRRVTKVKRITWELRDGPEEVEQQLPWNEEKTREHCYMRQGVWLLSDVKTQQFNPDLFSDEGASWEVPDDVPDGAEEEGGWYDLGIDWIPVYHMPNTVVDECEHFGVSSLSAVLQIFDDIVSTDSDLQKASATTGSPPIWLKNATLDGNAISTYGPGEVLETGDGEAGVIDTSKSLTALTAYNTDLHKRLSVGSRVPETLLGQVEPHKVNAGIILTLSFAPHSGLVREMRQIRDAGHQLILKGSLRFMVLGGTLELKDPANIPVADIKLGSYLPADKTEVMGIITNGASNNMMSRHTTVAMMIEAGYPIDDIQEELRRIHMEDFAGALKLEQATMDNAAVRSYLRGDPAIELEGDDPKTPIQAETAPNDPSQAPPQAVLDAQQQAAKAAAANRPNSTPPGKRL